MDYGRLLTRSFQVTLRSRALWVFGILLALTGGGGGGPNINWNLGRGDFGGPNQGLPSPTLPRGSEQAILVVVGVVACIVILLVLLATVLRLISRGASIGLVNELETRQVTPTVRHGFRIGSDRFASLLGIALLINVPLALISIVLLAVAALPMLASILPLIGTAGSRPPDQALGLLIPAILGSVGALCCVGLLLVLVSFVIRPFYEFMVRVCVIEKRGAMDSIREGYRLVRAHLGNTIFLYILVIGVGIAFAILMIPIVLVLLGIPALAAFLAYLATNGYGLPIAVGLVLGIPMLLVMIFISGLFQAYESTLWTEGFLALTALSSVTPLAPVPADSSSIPPQTGP